MAWQRERKESDRDEMREEGRERKGKSGHNGKGKKMRRNTFLSPCLSRSAAKQSRPTKEKSLVLSESILKVNFKFKI